MWAMVDAGEASPMTMETTAQRSMCQEHLSTGETLETTGAGRAGGVEGATGGGRGRAGERAKGGRVVVNAGCSSSELSKMARAAAWP